MRTVQYNGGVNSYPGDIEVLLDRGLGAFARVDDLGLPHQKTQQGQRQHLETCHGSVSIYVPANGTQNLVDFYPVTP